MTNELPMLFVPSVRFDQQFAPFPASMASLKPGRNPHGQRKMISNLLEDQPKPANQDDLVGPLITSSAQYLQIMASSAGAFFSTHKIRALNKSRGSR